MKQWNLTIMGIVTLVLGILILMSVNRRKFNRRNAFGNPQYSSYGHKTVASFLEKLFKAIAWFLILGGLGALFSVWNRE